MKGFPFFLPFSLAAILAGLMVGGFAVLPSKSPNVMADFAEAGPGLFERELPFAIRLDETIVLDAWAVEPALRVAGGGGNRVILAERGQEVALSHGTAVVKGVGPWSGLYPDAGGNAMAALALDFDEAGEGDVLGVRDGEWIRVGADMAVFFRWTSSEEEARRLLADTPASMDSARWGVVDDRRVHWFSSFTRGEGTRLGSGVSLFLLGIDMNWRDAGRPGLGERPAVQVRSIKGNDIRDTWYPAEANHRGAAVIFEYPASRKRLLILCAWNEQEVLAAAYEEGKQTGVAALESGALWQPDGSAYTLRWRRALRGAVFVPLANSPFVAAMLEYGGREIQVRQGEALRIEDDIIRFSPGKRMEEYRVSILRSDGSEEQKVLRPGAGMVLSIESERNRYGIHHKNVRAGKGVEVEVLPRRSLRSIAVGIALLAAGIIGAGVSFGRSRALH